MLDAVATDQEVTTGRSPDASKVYPRIPGFVGSTRYGSAKFWDVRGVKDEAVAGVTRASRLLQHKMLQKSVAAYQPLQEFSDQEWLRILRTAALDFIDQTKHCRPDSPTHSNARLVSLTTGLPETRIRNAWSTLAEDLSRMQEILDSQFHTGEGQFTSTEKTEQKWVWAPAGRHVAVRIPGNFPTINITWLMALAMRRPVLLCASIEEPFTPHLLVKALYNAGLPDGSISLCFGEAPILCKLADQLLWPGELAFPVAGDSRRIRHYHRGCSKAIILDKSERSSLWTRLANMAIRGCGRLCTNLSALLVESRAEEAATELAEALCAFSILPLDHPKAIVPAFVDPTLARQIAGRVDEAIARGAVDITETVTGTTLQQERDGLCFLRPTVLQIAATDPLFGVELPFPFVTVAQSGRLNLAKLCRNSLIVSITGEDRALCHELVLEPTISKVFHGDHFDRDYDPAEPHEGYLADFLFQKKTIWPNYYGSCT